MEYGLLVLIAVCLGGGVGGGLLSAWSCHRRVLVLEQNLKIILDGFDDRLNQLSKMVIRQDKTEAAKVRWSKKDIDEVALANRLVAPGVSNQHPWDPRTWGKSS